MTADEREDHARRLGRTWATSVLRRMLHSGRRVEGGWPCTLTEARAHLLPEMASLAPDERAHLARVLYSSAREAWLAERDAILCED